MKKKEQTLKEEQQHTDGKRHSVALTIVFVLCVIVFLGCGGYLGIYYYTNHKAEEVVSDLKERIEEDTTENDGEVSYSEVGQTKVYKKYASLYEENPDFIGWLYIYGTRIDYPVMYTPEDEEYYLHRSFYGDYSAAGTLFVDADSAPIGTVPDNVIIYGHNMKAGTMFHDLLKYEEESFYQEHKTISFETLDGPGTYTVIAAFYTKAYPEEDTSHYNFYAFTNAKGKEEFDTYVEQAQAATAYTIHETASYGDHLLTLSTCAYHTNNGRFVVVAKKVE